MATNIKLNNDTANNIWTYSPQIDSESGNTLILNTANKFLDKDIKIILPGMQQTQTSASGFSLSISNVQGNSEVIVGSTNSGGYYPVTANNLSITGTFSASTAGLFNSGSDTDNDVDNASVGKIKAGSCTIKGGILSTSGFNKQDLALTLSNGNDTTFVTNSYALVSSKDTTNYPYYFKITGSTPAINGTTTANVTAITDTHTAGYIPAKAETNFRAAQNATPSVTVNSTEKSAYIGLKAATLSASVSVDSEGSASMSAGGFTKLTEGSTSNYYVTLNTTAGSAKATAGVSAAGYAVDQTKDSNAISVPVNGNGTKLYIPTNSIAGSVVDLSPPSVAVSGTASGMTTSETATSYYITINGTSINGSVKGKATAGAVTGIVAANVSNTSDVSTIIPTITGNGTKIYIPAGNVESPIATKGTVNNHSIKITPNVTYTTGYIPSSTKSGTPVTVAASDLVSGTLSISSSGTTDVTNYKNVSVLAASFTNGPSGGLTKNDYADKSDKGPVLISGDYLYINAGYTENQKISLAQLVPNDATISGELVGANYVSNSMLQTASAYDKDGKLFTGSIETKDNSNIALNISDETTTVTGSAGYYPDAISKDIGNAVGSTTCSGGALTWTNVNATIVDSSTTGIAIKVTRAAITATSTITTAGYTPTNDSFSTADPIEEAEETKYITGVTLANGKAFDITVPNGNSGIVTFHFSVANGNTTITST